MVFTELTNITFTYLLSLIRLVIYLTIWYNIISLQNKEIFFSSDSLLAVFTVFPRNRCCCVRTDWSCRMHLAFLRPSFLFTILFSYVVLTSLWVGGSIFGCISVWKCECVCVCFKESYLGINPNNQIMLFSVIWFHINCSQKLISATHGSVKCVFVKYAWLLLWGNPQH